MVLRKIFNIINNRNFILILAILLGLAFKNIAEWIKYLTIPALSIVMIVSLSQIPTKDFLNFKNILKPALYTILFNYILSGIVMLAMAWFLIDDKQLWIGFVMLAAAPPGVAIAPFAYIIGSDEKFSIIGMVGAYIASLAIIPLAQIAFIGSSFIRPLDLVIILLELIIGPLIISRIIVKFKFDKYLQRWRGSIINWGLFVVIFVVISLNREVFFDDLNTLLIISVISIVTIFGLWLLVDFSFKKIKVSPETRKSYILAATVKNSGFAAAAALALFGKRASLPGAIFGIYLVFFLVIIGILSRDKPFTKTKK